MSAATWDVVQNWRHRTPHRSRGGTDLEFCNKCWRRVVNIFISYCRIVHDTQYRKSHISTTHDFSARLALFVFCITTWRDNEKTHMYFEKKNNARTRTKTAIREARLQCSIVTWALLLRSFYCDSYLSPHSTAHLVAMPSMDSVHQCKCNLMAIPTHPASGSNHKTCSAL